MKLNPNAASFMPGAPQQQAPIFNPQQQSFQPGGFNNQPFLPQEGQYGGPVNYNFQQFQPQYQGQMGPQGPYGQFQQGGNQWGGGYNQQEFPSYQGPAYVQPNMTFNGDMNVASFSRKPPMGTKNQNRRRSLVRMDSLLIRKN